MNTPYVQRRTDSAKEKGKGDEVHVDTDRKKDEDMEKENGKEKEKAMLKVTRTKPPPSTADSEESEKEALELDKIEENSKKKSKDTEKEEKKKKKKEKEKAKGTEEEIVKKEEKSKQRFHDYTDYDMEGFPSSFVFVTFFMVTSIPLVDVVKISQMENHIVAICDEEDIELVVKTLRESNQRKKIVFMVDSDVPDDMKLRIKPFRRVYFIKVRPFLHSFMRALLLKGDCMH